MTVQYATCVGDPIRIRYRHANGEIEVISGVVVPSLASQPNHLHIELDGSGDFQNYDPLRILDWCYL